MIIKCPIIVDDTGDLLVFESVEDAERYIEPIDLDDCVGYDSEGRLLQFIATDANRKTIIRSTEAEPTHSIELRKAIVWFLSYLDISKEWLSNASLSELVEKMLNYKIK